MAKLTICRFHIFFWFRSWFLCDARFDSRLAPLGSLLMYTHGMFSSAFCFLSAIDLALLTARWIPLTKNKQYAIRILLVAEFEDCANGDGSEEAVRNCKSLLDNVDAIPSETWWNWLVLVALFAVFRLLALAVLRKKATKFF